MGQQVVPVLQRSQPPLFQAITSASLKDIVSALSCPLRPVSDPSSPLNATGIQSKMVVYTFIPQLLVIPWSLILRGRGQDLWGGN